MSIVGMGALTVGGIIACLCASLRREMVGADIRVTDNNLYFSSHRDY